MLETWEHFDHFHKYRSLSYKVIWKEKNNCIGKRKCDHLATRWCHINASMFSRHDAVLLWIFIWSVKPFIEVLFQGKQKPRAQVSANGTKRSYSGPGMERGEWILGGRPISHTSTCFESVLKVEGEGASFRHMLPFGATQRWSIDWAAQYSNLLYCTVQKLAHLTEPANNLLC